VADGIARFGTLPGFDAAPADFSAMPAWMTQLAPSAIPEEG